MHGNLHEDAYVVVPPYLKPYKSNHMWNLIKPLYGLKQAMTQWYEKLTSLLIQHCCTQATSDHTLFVKRKDASFSNLFVLLVM